MQDNAAQRDYWNGPVAESWVARQDQFDRGFAELTDALLAFAAPKPGEAVLDVGCGAGTTTLAMAKAVAPGKVLGVDISAPLLGLARRRAGDAATFVEADASSHVFAPEFDLAVSRFGVMFFADPVTAFANIKMALKPGGRLAFICWRHFEEVPALYECFAAARDLLPPTPLTPSGEPGPFGLADGERTRRILAEAGYRDIRIEKSDPRSLMGATLEEAIDHALNIGPLARAVREMAPDAKARVAERIAPVLQRYGTVDGFAPPIACWLVGASA